MQTNIEVDDRLMAEAMEASGKATPREAIEAGLRLLVRRGRIADLRRLRGAVEWDGDLDVDRSDIPGRGAS